MEGKKKNEQNKKNEEKKRRMCVPGIFLKANLFGDWERKDDQDSSDHDGKLAVDVPGDTDCTICLVGDGFYH